jgi:hypothetical protein
MLSAYTVILHAARLVAITIRTVGYISWAGVYRTGSSMTFRIFCILPNRNVRNQAGLSPMFHGAYVCLPHIGKAPNETPPCLVPEPR